MKQIFLSPKHVASCKLDGFLNIECQLHVTIAVIDSCLKIELNENHKNPGII